MNFIFDMGNVVVQNVDVLPGIQKATGVSIQEITDFSGQDFAAVSSGSLEPQAFWEAFNKQFGCSVNRDLLDVCFNPVTDTGMINFISWLRHRNHRVVCGTNTIHSHHVRLKEMGLHSIFDEVYASHIMGIVKPDPEFYSYILREEGWEPDNCIFVDDLKENIESAASLGIHAIQYTYLENLKAQLTEFRIFQHETDWDLVHNGA